MKRNLILAPLLFMGTGILPQFGAPKRPVTAFVVQGAISCTGTFNSSNATELQVDCTAGTSSVMSGAKVALASITGNTAGAAFSLRSGSDHMTLILRRLSTANPLHVEAVINGAPAYSQDVPVP